MSRELMCEAVVKLGFTEREAKVYVQLTTGGPQSSRDIAKALNLRTRYICASLKKLESRGFVEANHTCRVLFLAVSFENVLDLLIRDNIEQANHMMKSKKELLSTWRSIVEKDFRDQ